MTTTPFAWSQQLRWQQANPLLWWRRYRTTSADGASPRCSGRNRHGRHGDRHCFQPHLTEDDTIAWYENDGVIDPSGQRLISTPMRRRASVFVADMDGNVGGIDIVSASVEDDTIAWYESDGAIYPLLGRTAGYRYQ